MVRITKVYTRTGDAGATRLVGGQEVQKTDLRIEAYGTVDELNATLGLVRAELSGQEGALLGQLDAELERVQQHLFDLGAELACLPEDFTERMPRVTQAAVDDLEAGIDALNADLPTLTSFVLPGGGRLGALFHLARTVCRRTERRVLQLGSAARLRPDVVRFLNRLSDYLFVAGRAATRAVGGTEALWKPSGAPRGRPPTPEE